MLRIAVPNKGSLSEPTVTLLREAGYHVHRTGRELTLLDHSNQVEFFFLRPRDIAVYVGQGTVAAGFTGRDLLLDSAVPAREHLALGFACANFRFAAPPHSVNALSALAGKRIATSYDTLVKNYLDSQGISATVVHLDGAVESSVRLGVADAVADVVETGSTLAAAGLQVFGDPILRSEAVLITNDTHADDSQLATLVGRLQGVLLARSYILIDYNAPVASLEELLNVTPGFDSPTISPLHDENWRAVRAMVRRSEVNPVLDRLSQLGARGILVTEIMACRL